MVRHLTMAELLALRDNEGTAAARSHLEECQVCASEFERIHQRVATARPMGGHPSAGCRRAPNNQALDRRE